MSIDFTTVPNKVTDVQVIISDQTPQTKKSRSKQSSTLTAKQKSFISSQQEELMKLDNYEVFISMLKFSIGLGVYNRAYVYKSYGITNGIISDTIIMIQTLISNTNLIECMQFLPNEMTQPNSNLTFGKVVEYVLDNREYRINAGVKSDKKYHKVILDFFIFYQEIMCVAVYGKYVIDQTLLLKGQSHYNIGLVQSQITSFLINQNTLLVFIGLFILGFSFISMKQLSYISRLAMALTIFELIYLNIEILTRYFAIIDENTMLNYHRKDQIKLPINIKQFDQPLWPNLLILTCVGSGQFEGTPLIPALYSNSLNKDQFNRSIKYSILIIYIYIIVFSPISILTYGNKVQEIIFMNLIPNELQLIMISTFIFVQLFTTGFNFIPMVHILNNYFPEYSIGYKGIIQRLFIIVIILNMIPNMKSVTLVMQLSSTLACNVIVMILPNYMWIKMQQEKDLNNTNRFKGKYHEIQKYLSYFVAIFGVFAMTFGTIDILIKIQNY